MQERYIEHLDKLVGLAEKEVERTGDDPGFNRLAEFYLKKFQDVRRLYNDVYDRDIISALRQLQEAGKVELITCSATHAFLPYLKTEEGVRAQIETAILSHERHFGRRPRGMWLPECGFIEKLDGILAEYDITFFFTDAHGVIGADPSPRRGVYAPLFTPFGVAAFARESEASKQVWSSIDGYPGDYDYREYYRDIGYDADYEYIKPYLPKPGTRLNTGIKYYRVTGHDSYKELYNPDRAREKAAIHAGDFMFKCKRRVESVATHIDRCPLIVAVYDAELFGHWWYEGPQFIDFLCRKLYYDQNALTMVTPTEYLQDHPKNDRASLGFSSWGRGGYGDVWLQRCNHWTYRSLHIRSLIGEHWLKPPAS